MNEKELVSELASGYFMSWKNRIKNTTQFCYERIVQPDQLGIIEEMANQIPLSKIGSRLVGNKRYPYLIVYHRSSLHLIRNLITGYIDQIEISNPRQAVRFRNWVNKMEEHERLITERRSQAYTRKVEVR